MPAFFEEGTPLNGRLAPVEQLRGTPVFSSHGGQDQMTPKQIGLQNAALFAEHVERASV